MVVAMMFACNLICRRRGYGEIIPFELRRVGRTLPGASIGLAAIGIILYGIYTGVFSPTESSAVAAGSCLFAGLFTTCELKWCPLPSVLFRRSFIFGILMPRLAIWIGRSHV